MTRVSVWMVMFNMRQTAILVLIERGSLTRVLCCVMSCAYLLCKDREKRVHKTNSQTAITWKSARRAQKEHDATMTTRHKTTKHDTTKQVVDVSSSCAARECGHYELWDYGTMKPTASDNTAARHGSGMVQKNPPPLPSLILVFGNLIWRTESW